MIWYILTVVIYVLVAMLTIPASYKVLRDRVPNSYHYLKPNETARNQSYWHGAGWPVGLPLLYARRSMFHIDDKAELTKQERAELDRFRAEAMRELGD